MRDNHHAAEQSFDPLPKGYQPEMFHAAFSQHRPADAGRLFSRLMFGGMLLLLALAALLGWWLYQRQPPEFSLVVAPYAHRLKQVPIESTASDITQNLSVLELHRPDAVLNAPPQAQDIPQAINAPIISEVIDSTNVPGLQLRAGLAEQLLDQQDNVRLSSSKDTMDQAGDIISDDAMQAVGTAQRYQRLVDKINAHRLLEEQERLQQTQQPIPLPQTVSSSQPTLPDTPSDTLSDTPSVPSPLVSSLTRNNLMVNNEVVIRAYLASLPTRDAAAAAIQDFFRQYSQWLVALQTTISAVTSEGQTQYRVYAEGFVSLAQAEEWCRGWQNLVGMCQLIHE